MSVESFDPGAAGIAVDPETVQRLLQASAAEAPDFGLSQLERASLASVMTDTRADWAALCSGLSDEQIEQLIRFFTQAEEAISGWQAGAKSPVIPLAKVLKTRGTYKQDLTRWIKANSSNRFLPHGSLMDRL